MPSGTTYAWGKNQRGQLGTSNKLNSYEPVPILNTKERFVKVACGYNFSLGLTATNRLYFWGNFKYFGELKRTKDVEEPTVMPSLESVDVDDIAVCYKICYVLSIKGNLQ